MSRRIPGPAGLLNASECIDFTSDHPQQPAEATSFQVHQQLSWVKICESLCIKVPDGFQRHSSLKMDRVNMLDNMKEGGIEVTIENILEGCYDLKVPRMIAMVTQVTHKQDDSWILELQDPSGKMNGFITAPQIKQLESLGGNYISILNKGTTVLLEQVSIFVSKGPPMIRYLSIHSKCVMAVC